MKKLNENLKRMLTALAQQDAAEFLPMRDKMKALGLGTQPERKPSWPGQRIAPAPATRRIALITDGRGLGAPLDYAIDSCSRLKTRIDLLVHGEADTANIGMLEKQINASGIEFLRIRLGLRPVEDIINHVSNHPSLSFLVAMPDDVVARKIIEDVIPGRGRRFTVPLVLIEDRSSLDLTEQSAA